MTILLPSDKLTDENRLVFSSCDPGTQRPAAFLTPFFKPTCESDEEEFPSHPRDFTSSLARNDHSTLISHVFNVHAYFGYPP